jgi:(E)-4-hydroxy-3-methylbut-2-enyl-diphosphate synthase
MWKDKITRADLDGERGAVLVRRIERLGEMGCALLRFAVPDEEGAETLGRLAEMVSMPLVADIHFDYRLALRCLDFPIAKIRINPGNIGAQERTARVVEKAAQKGAPIRIGLNAGSLPADVRERVEHGELAREQALIIAAERELAVFEELGFDNVVISAKASSASETIRVNRLLRQFGAPIHAGVTEAGPLVAGVARNTAALCVLLGEDIGDTVRVSLSDSVENEVIAAREIIGIASRREKAPGITIISCPRCGRNSFDTHAFTEKWLPALYALKKNADIAIMGCVVNGPGEAKHADLGITGAGDKALLFRHGTIVKTVNLEDADAAFGDCLSEL